MDVMYDGYTDRACRVLLEMQTEAFVLDHDHVGTEHLLLAIVDANDDLTAPVLRRFGASVDPLRREVQKLVTPGIDVDADYEVLVFNQHRLDEDTVDADRSGQDAVAQSREFTPRLLRCLMSLSPREAEALGDERSGTEHLLLAVLNEGNGLGVRALSNLGVDTAELRRAIYERIAEAPEANDLAAQSPSDEDRQAALDMRRTLAVARMVPEDRVLFSGSEAARVFCVLDGVDQLFTGDSGEVIEQVTKVIRDSFARRAGRTDQFTPEQERQILSSIVSSLRRQAAEQLGD